MYKERNHQIIDVYAKDAVRRGVETYAVILLIKETGDIYDQFGFSEAEDVEKVKDLFPSK